MNEKLKEKCIEYISTNFTIDETMMEDVPLSDRQYVFWLDDVSKLAEHFYNIALADVKIEVERNKDKTDNRYDNLHSPANPQDIDEKQLEKIKANLVAKRSFLSGEINGYDKILDYIDNLTK